MVKRNKKVFGMLMAAAVISTMSVSSLSGITAPISVQASDKVQKASGYKVVDGVVDLGEGDASITVNGNMSQSMVNKQFELFKLFNAENAKGGESINYTFNPVFAESLQKVVAEKLNERDGSNLKPSEVTEYMCIDYIQTLNTNPVEGANADQKLEGRYSQFRYFVEDLRNQIKKDNVNGDIITVESVKADNAIKIEGLSYGYYILDEISTTDDQGEDWFANSLCMVNTANPDAEVNIKSDYPAIIKKIQEDDNRGEAGLSADGWNDIADYEIGQTVPYKYVSSIPDMEGYHSYYYAWHDVMDEALTLNTDKSKISIVIEQGDKSYKLADDEYVLTENPDDGSGDTFKIEVADIKKIIDEQFFSDTTREADKYVNKYADMTVTLNYEATLNDKASLDTGRPGFENDVRLEFSNDADSDGQGSTGYTPWDTVVCFTYKINGLKVNNHDVKLEGAKFRLYSDEACTEEVYVKKMTGGYHVINRDSLGGTDHTGGEAPAEATEMISDAEGVFTIIGLDGGTYWLKETDAPDGYRPLLDPIKITIEPEFTVSRDTYIKGDGATDKTLKSLSAKTYVKEFLSGKYVETNNDLVTDVEDGSANLTVVNTVGTKLPITGSGMTMVMIGLGASAMGYVLVKNRKREVK